MEHWAALVRAVARKKAITELAAAQELAREAGGFGAITILAAYVEMVEPTP
jgi:hypothetical protein